MGNMEATPASLSVVPERLGLRDALVKVVVFAVIQALVYLILRKSSDLFTPAGGKKETRSFSFRPMRSTSVRRVLAAFSDVPVGVPEEAPSPRSPLDPAAAPDRASSSFK